MNHSFKITNNYEINHKINPFSQLFTQIISSKSIIQFSPFFIPSILIPINHLDFHYYTTHSFLLFILFLSPIFRRESLVKFPAYSTMKFLSIHSLIWHQVPQNLTVLKSHTHGLSPVPDRLL